ncbi:MAG: FAD-dependent oxidoreductase [Methanobacteriota archaeon]
MTTTNPKKKKICIIGAGLAGLTTGALLTQKGYPVEIFEKEPFIGGRAHSFTGDSLTLDQYQQLLTKFHMNLPFSEPSIETIFENNMLQGYTLDLGYHLIGGGVVSNLSHILSSLQTHIDILGSRLGYIQQDGYQYPFLSTMDKIRMSPQILRLFFASDSTMQQLDQQTMTQTITKYGKGKMKLTLELFSRVITTVNNLDKISSGETLRAQKGLLRGSTPVGYPKNGLKNISEILSRYITNNGGIIHLETPVQHIIINQEAAQGVTVNNQDLFFDTIISNILVQDLFTIAPEKHFPTDYVHTLKTLEGTGSLCAYYSLKHLDEHIRGKSFLFIERNAGVDGNDAVGMIDCLTTAPGSMVSPPGHHLIQAYIICTPDEAQNQHTLHHLQEILDTQLERIIPKYHSQLEWALYPAIWQLDGVAKTIDNIKPEIETPIQNLYLIGDCVKAPGIGINCALNSAKILTQKLLS